MLFNQFKEDNEEMMPELPEVETMKRAIEKLVKKETILKSLKPLNLPSLLNATSTAVKNNHIIDIERIGKYLIFHLDDQRYITIHFRMSGSFALRGHHNSLDIHDRVIFQFDTFTLAFHDPRKFGKVTICSSITPLKEKLGYDALDKNLSAELFYSMCHGKKKMIKSFLLEQNHICGLGNIYVDEILFASNIHPQRSCRTLSIEECALIIVQMRRILTSSILHGGTSLGDGDGNFQSEGKRGSYQQYLQVFQRKGKKCLRCQTPIEITKVNGRTTHWCPSCQKS